LKLNKFQKKKKTLLNYEKKTKRFQFGSKLFT
jgi:hypothetical protein